MCNKMFVTCYIRIDISFFIAALQTIFLILYKNSSTQIAFNDIVLTKIEKGAKVFTLAE